MKSKTCLDVFEACVNAIKDGELIEAVSSKDKEFHFQNWFQNRLTVLGLLFDPSGRNTYPDFRMVEHCEGFEVKGLAWPGRERDYDCNSQVPSGYHNGRTIYYVFGRYPADLKPYNGRYPVIDLVVCHGGFLNADHAYIHKNKHVKGFGSYGDIMIRDRKMYVAPTPFALTEGTTGLKTLILPSDFDVDKRFKPVGSLTRVESDDLVIGYKFDLRTNTIVAEKAGNPSAGKQHQFIAYRLSDDSDKQVTMTSNALDVVDASSDEE